MQRLMTYVTIYSRRRQVVTTFFRLGIPPRRLVIVTLFLISKTDLMMFRSMELQDTMISSAAASHVYSFFRMTVLVLHGMNPTLNAVFREPALVSA